MRNLILMAVAAASLFSLGCVVPVHSRPVARYHYVGGPPPPPPRYYGHRHHYYRDDHGYHHDYR